MVFRVRPGSTHGETVDGFVEVAVESLSAHNVYLSVLDPDTPVEVQARIQIERSTPPRPEFGGRPPSSSSSSARADPMTVVGTSAGRVHGNAQRGVHAFLGIPYAQPPVGPLRFAAPVPHSPWDGVREATEFGSPPPQPMRATPTDEWLTVNVWTPDPDASGLPVMVWLYGGRFTTGAADEPECDGSRLASGGVVVVSLNYRVGPEGFMVIEGAVPNRGLLDQIAALHWVHDNIAAFGGDPDNVTVFGQSAGAAAVTMLMIAPAAAGVFRRGIAQSVPPFLFGIDLATDVGAVIAGKLGCRPTVDDLAERASAAVGRRGRRHRVSGSLGLPVERAAFAVRPRDRRNDSAREPLSGNEFRA